MSEALTTADVARQAEATEPTLRRWVRSGVIQSDDGAWTPAAAAQARMVARLRGFREPTELFVAAVADA